MKYTYNILLLLFILTSCSNNTDDENNSDCTYTPTLFTQEVSNIMETSAEFNGQIIAPTCESTVTSQGFVYAKTTLPKTDDFVVEVSGENISSDVIDLERNTKYYMRTFFVNPTGVYYGNQIEITTAIGEINITTKTIENVTYNSAKSGGIIVDDGDGTILNKGVSWSTSPSPTVDDSKIEDNLENYDFNSEITGLSEDTTYYLRAYATNENGTNYGNEKTFKTSTSAFKVELKITGYTNSCSVQAPYFNYEIYYKFDNNDVISDGLFDGGEGTSRNHSKEEKIHNKLEVTIHLGQFNPDSPSETLKGAYLDNMSIVITNLGTNEEVLNTSLPSLFICTDVAYKNIINFNPEDSSYTIEQLTYGF